MVAYLGMRGQNLSVAIGLVAGLCFFLFGYDQGDLAGLLTVKPFLKRFPQIDTVGSNDGMHTSSIQGITVAAWNLGCFLSCMLTMFLGDVLGRKKTIFLGLSFLIIGEVIQASSFSFGQFVAGRVIAGFGNGFNTATVPAWQAECTKAHRRGTLLMISAGACIAAGLSFSYWMDFAFGWFETSSVAWRMPVAIQLFFALLTLMLLIGMPESPRWLILQGREQEALQVLSALNDLPPSDTQIHQEFLQIKDAVLEMAGGSFGAVFSMGDYRHIHRVVLAFMLQIFQQMTGINLVTQYFAIMLLDQYSYAGWSARLVAACAGTEFFLASFVAVVGIDRFWGRRSLMLFGATGMSGCMIILAIMKYLNNTASDITATVFLFLFCSFFAIGWQGMAWLYQVEIVPLRIRGPANALSTAANWLINFVVVLIAPVAMDTIGYKTYIIFAVTNFCIIPAIYYLYPETGFRSLEEVDVIFHAASQAPGNPWLQVRRIAANEPLWYGRGSSASGSNEAIEAKGTGYNYEDSAWHQRHVVRWSDKSDPLAPSSSGDDSRTLANTQGGGEEKVSSEPSRLGGWEGSGSSDEERLRGGTMAASETSDSDDGAAPAPVIQRGTGRAF